MSARDDAKPTPGPRPSLPVIPTGKLTVADLDLFLVNPIAYHPVFADLTGKPSHALFLSQCFYWSKKYRVRRRGWFYLSFKGWHEQTRLTRAMIDKAVEKLGPEGLGLIEKRVVQTRLDNKRMYFRIHWPRFLDALDAHRQRMAVAAKVASVSDPEAEEPGFWNDEPGPALPAVAQPPTPSGTADDNDEDDGLRDEADDADLAQLNDGLAEDEGNTETKPAFRGVPAMCGISTHRSAENQQTGVLKTDTPERGKAAHRSAENQQTGARITGAPERANSAHRRAEKSRTTTEISSETSPRENNNTGPAAPAAPDVVALLGQVRVTDPQTGKQRPLAKWLFRVLEAEPVERVQQALKLFHDEVTRGVAISLPEGWIREAVLKGYQPKAASGDEAADIADDARMRKERQSTPNGREYLTRLDAFISGMTDEQFAEETRAAIARMDAAGSADLARRFRRRPHRDAFRLCMSIEAHHRDQDTARRQREEVQRLQTLMAAEEQDRRSGASVPPR